MNFPESSLANLSSLGYTEDEARFLYVVATHSGYFSMRQFLQFTGTKSGDKSMTFSRKLLGKGHATARSFLRNGLVYHLFSRRDTWLRHSEAASYLGVSKSTLYHYSSGEQIERRKFGGRLEYRRSALDHFKQAHTLPAGCRAASARIIASAHSSGK
jgi:predicted DNA-binding transcriptional regulator AlpA